MTRAAGYTRVSTEEQAREGYGLAAQEQSVRAYCQAQGWELARVYSDAGRSGKDVEGRDGLKQLLADAEASLFDRVVFGKLDRLGRSLRDLLAICDELEALNVGVVSLQEAIDTATPAGRMMRNMLGSLAEFERETIVERIRAGLEEKARQGELIGPLPLGYLRDDEGVVVLDEQVAPLIRSAFEHYATGDVSLRDMVHWAEEVGLRSKAGKPLDRLSIRKLLTNPTYAGQVAYKARSGDGGILAAGRHPAVVEVDLFAKVQQVLVERRRNSRPTKPWGRTPYPLSGIAVCTYDGAPMVGVTAGNDRKRYMRCSTAQRRGKDACRQPMVRADVLENQVAARFAGLHLSDEHVSQVVQELQRRQDAHRDPDKPRQLEREVDRWHRLFVIGEIDEQRLKRETAPLKAQLIELSQRAAPADIERAADYLRDLGNLWSQSPRKLRREFVLEVVEQVLVRGREVTAVALKKPYDAFLLRALTPTESTTLLEV